MSSGLKRLTRNQVTLALNTLSPKWTLQVGISRKRVNELKDIKYER